MENMQIQMRTDLTHEDVALAGAYTCSLTFAFPCRRRDLRLIGHAEHAAQQADADERTLDAGSDSLAEVVDARVVVEALVLQVHLVQTLHKRV